MILILVALMLAAPAAEAQDASSQTADSTKTAPTTLSVSMDRIRRGLQKTPKLRVDVPMPVPTYKVQIVQNPYFLEVPYKWDWGVRGGVPTTAPNVTATGGNQWTPPLISSGNMLPLFTSFVHGFAERAAEREVQQTILEFCAQYSCVLKQ